MYRAVKEAVHVHVYVSIFVYTLHFNTGSVIRKRRECGRFYSLERSILCHILLRQPDKVQEWKFSTETLIYPARKYHWSVMNCQLLRVLWHNINLFQYNSASFCDDSVHNLWTVTVICSIYDIVISLVKYIYSRKLFLTLQYNVCSTYIYVYIYTKLTFVTVKHKSDKVYSISLLVLLLFFITFMQGIYNYIRETTYVYRVYICIYCCGYF
jgi:hypothetical protein